MKSYFHELAIIKGEAMINDSLFTLLKKTLQEMEKKNQCKIERKAQK